MPLASNKHPYSLYVAVFHVEAGWTWKLSVRTRAVVQAAKIYLKSKISDWWAGQATWSVYCQAIHPEYVDRSNEV